MATKSVFSRDAIGVEQLHSLKEKFADGDLNEKEFVRLFREIIDPNLSETQLTHLFQKIDANSDGTVDWDELTNYMFLASSDQGVSSLELDSGALYDTSHVESISKATDTTNETSAVRPAQYHRDLVTKLLRLEKSNQIASASKDGTVRLWNANNMSYQSTLATGRNWITDCCLMRKYNRIAVSSMDRTVSFYDLSTGQSIGYVCDKTRSQGTPMSLEYIHNPTEDVELLVVGDDTGAMSVMRCSSQWSTCDGRAGGTMVGDHVFSKKSRIKKHSDWITKVKYIDELRSIVTTSLDTKISIVDAERMVVKFEYARHRKGVFDLCWSSKTRLLASCGMERDISIWNPYSCQRAVATLRGHNASVMHIDCDDDNYQIISLSSDNTVKVWDVRTHKCMQTFVDKHKITGGMDNRISSMLYDSKTSSLITATNLITKWPKCLPLKDQDVKSDSSLNPRVSHTVRYNPAFNQVVTAEISNEGFVRTWNVETGEEISNFSNAHDGYPITAISFDGPGRRLLTGSHDGKILKMWNFSNGALVKTFFKHSSGEQPSKEVGRKVVHPSTTSTALSSSQHEVHHNADALTTSTSSNQAKEKGKGKGKDKETNSCSPSKRDIKSTSNEKESTMKSPTRPEKPTDGSTTTKPKSHSFRNFQRSEMIDQTGANCSQNSARKVYQQDEVTCILDIERNVRLGIGEYFSQRFVCSVGWDRKIHIWLDENGEDKAFPIFVLPSTDELKSPIDASKYHTEDILSVVYIPPAYIATTGLDGKIIIWNINSGEFKSEVYSSEYPIGTMLYSNKLEVLMAATEIGDLLCFDRTLTCIAKIPLNHPEDEVVVCLQSDSSSDHLITGDAGGVIKVWDINADANDTGFYLEYDCHWHVGEGKIIDIEFVESSQQIDLFLLTSCIQGDVCLWTMDGVKVGTFGKRQWNLGTLTSYENRESSVTNANAEWGKNSKYYIPSYTAMAVALKTVNGVNAVGSSVLSEESLPKDNEVWVSVSGFHTGAADQTNFPILETSFEDDENHEDFRYRLKSRKSSIEVENFILKEEKKKRASKSTNVVNHYLRQNVEKLNNIVDIITIVKINKGELVGWDGMSSSIPEQKCIDLKDFSRSTAWVKHARLTNYIGKIFLTEEKQPFKVLYVGLKKKEERTSAEDAFFFVDTKGQTHCFQPAHAAVQHASFRFKSFVKGVMNTSTGLTSLLKKTKSKTAATARMYSSRGMLSKDSNTLQSKKSFRSKPVGDEEQRTDYKPISSSDRNQTQTIGNNLSKSDSIRDSVRGTELVGDSTNYVQAEKPPQAYITLPEINRKPKRTIGGSLPKRSALRVKHDASIDFRRVHDPRDIPRGLKDVMRQVRSTRTRASKNSWNINP